MNDKQKAINNVKVAILVAEFLGSIEACAVGSIKLVDALEAQFEVTAINDINQAAYGIIKIILESTKKIRNKPEPVPATFEACCNELVDIMSDSPDINKLKKIICSR